MAVKFGVNNHAGLYTESVEVEDTIETAILKGSKGVSKVVHPFDPLKKFALKTRGEPSALAVGVGDPQITGLNGGVTVIESVKNAEQNTDFMEANSTGTNYPNGEAYAEEGGGEG